MIESEKIKGFILPKKLVFLIQNGTWENIKVTDFQPIAPFLNFPLELLKNVSTIKSISKDVEILSEDFMGVRRSLTEGEEINFPWLDFDNSIFIAVNKYPGEDLMIALDYRWNKKSPAVVASNFNKKHSHCEWEVIAENFDTFYKKMVGSNERGLVKTSPMITHAEWGKIKINEKVFKDVKCYPNGQRQWDWNETGTRHMPGIQIADILELLENGSEIIILSKGYHEKLQIHPETEEYLNERNIPYFILQTEKAVQKYNELRDSKRVGGLFHSTC